MIRLIFAGLATLAFLPQPAVAEDGAWRVGNHEIHIVDSRMDVSTPAGRAILLARVDRAADRLCRDRPGNARQCRQAVIAETARLNGNAWGRGLALAMRESTVRDTNGEVMVAR